MILVEEGIGSLDLIIFVVIKTKYLTNSRIIMYNDNKKYLRNILDSKKGKWLYLRGRSNSWKIQYEIQISTIEIKVEYSNNKIRWNQVFEYKPK